MSKLRFFTFILWLIGTGVWLSRMIDNLNWNNLIWFAISLTFSIIYGIDVYNKTRH